MVARLLHVLLVLFRGPGAMNRSQWVWTRTVEPTEPAPDTWLVVPDLQLLFCAIPKNACTQFNKVMNALNGIDNSGARCGPWDPNFLSKPSFVLRSRRNRYSLKSLLEDPTWTKAVFLRNPLERLVSAFRSKCEPPLECGGWGCMNLDPRKIHSTEGPTFEEWMAEFKKSNDVHYTPQSHFCGGLSPESFNRFDYVGVVTRNYNRVWEQVNDMMLLAFDRSQKAAQENTRPTFLPKRGNVSRGALDKVIRTYFPTAGPDANNVHNHRTTNIMRYYAKPQIHVKARRTTTKISSCSTPSKVAWGRRRVLP